MMLWTVVFGGCACNPDLPEDNDPPTADTAAPSSSTADTGPLPACAFPESEPNDSPDEANVMGTEQRACGTLAEGDLFDVFEVELDDDGWVEVEVEAASGSVADVEYLFSNDQLAVAATNGIDTTDARLAFQVASGVYNLRINDEFLQGSDRHTYQALVSEIKAPVEWDFEEIEPNDDFMSAQSLDGGGRVFGMMAGDGEADEDWYVVGIPTGRFDVTIDVDAMEYGSGADTEVRLYGLDQGSTVPQEVIVGGGVNATRPDPRRTVPRLGEAVLFVVVRQQGEAEPESVDRWYVLDVTLEAR